MRTPKHNLHHALFSGEHHIIKPSQPVIIQAGTRAPKSSVNALGDFFTTTLAPTKAVANPFIRKAVDQKYSTHWLLKEIDNTQIQWAKKNIEHLAPLARKNLAVFKAEIGLNDSPEADNLALVFSTWIDVNAEDITALKPQSQQHKRLGITKRQLSRPLFTLKKRLYTTLMAAQQEALNADVKHKNTMTLMDTVFPRLVIMGHSQGGSIGLKALQREAALFKNTGIPNSIGMVMGLGAPFSGFSLSEVSLREELSEKALGFTEKLLFPVYSHFFKSLQEMSTGHQEIQKLQNRNTPDDTTVISLFYRDNKDGIVSTRSGQLNKQLTGMVNLPVTPKETPLSSLAPSNTHGLINKLKLNHFLDESSKTHYLRTHSGHIGFPEFYWSKDWETQNSTGNADILKQLFEAPERLERITTLLDSQQYEPLREQILKLLIERIQTQPESKPDWIALLPTLQSIASVARPFSNSCDKLAKSAISLLKNPET